MRKKIGLGSVCIPLLCGILGQAASGRDAEAKAVNAAFDRYVLGWQKGDLSLLSGVYANDVRLTAYWPDPTRPSPAHRKIPRPWIRYDNEELWTRLF